MNEQSKDLVVKANNINEGFIDMTKTQYKFTLYAISKIDKNQKEFRKVNIYEKELKEILEWKGGSLYEYLKDFEKQLISKSISLYSIKGNRVNINWYSYTKYNNKEGCLEVAFNHDLAPYLLDIDTSYTKYLLDNIKNFSSKYTTRIYEILIQYSYRGKLNKAGEFCWIRTVALDELKKMLGISDSKVKLYGDLKRSILLKAQKEFIKNPDTDIIFDFKEIKIGRSVTAVDFIVKYKKETTKPISTPKIPIELIENFIVKFNKQYKSNLAGTEQTKKIVIKLANEKSLPRFEECFDKFAQVIAAEVVKGNIRSLEGLFMNFVKHGYNFNTNMMGEVGIEANFDQREYKTEDFEQYYYKVPEE